jgi:O-antigen ligase
MKTVGDTLNRWIPAVDLRRATEADPLFYGSAFALAASLILGGGTRAGFLSDAILQLLTIPLLLIALWRLFELEISKPARLALVFLLAIAAVPLLQLIPLPGQVWTLLPHRSLSAENFALVKHALPWMPISVYPEGTWLSVLALIPPLAIFLSTLQLGYRDRRWLSIVILAVGVLSVFIGLIQVAQGQGSSLRFFTFTNPTDPVGFFANRNHFAALAYTLIVLTSAWAVTAAAEAGSAFSRREYDAKSIIAALGCFTLLVVLLAAEAMARSRAGLILAIVALLGGFALGFSDRRVKTGGFTPGKLLLAAMALAVVFAVQFTLYRILERFDVDPIEGARLSFVRNTIEAAKAYMPLGSGIGSFVPVYGLFERPQDTLIQVYVNHAHNDVAETLLEAGVLGLCLMVAFFTWLVWRAVEIWRKSPPPGAREIDWALARSATVVVALIAAHSFLDYPLRTSAMMGVMAFACALLIEAPLSKGSGLGPSKEKRSEALGAVWSPSHAPLLTMRPRQVEVAKEVMHEKKATDERWGSDIHWPEEWRSSAAGPIDDKSSPS